MDMKKLMKQAQKMQAEAQAAQEELKNMTFEGSAGGGIVGIVLNGECVLQSIKIDPEGVDLSDIDMLEDTIMAAYNEAYKLASETATERFSAMGGGNFGGLF